ncbi:GNAT family N-acetyltransferase [Burkholderiaceae bacterium DAT-1]|nr:GNAT family N-acetyltransferase [Burkholderiaceae bacterium DAT-1]
MTILLTPRLRLEPLSDQHFEPLHALNSLPEVMRYITGKPNTPEDTQRMIDRANDRWPKYGFSWWAWIDRERDQFVGTGCIQHLGWDPDNPLEIGWRLHPAHWRKGYASEAAQAMAAFAFDDQHAPVLRAICHPDNTASAAVMKRLGMHACGVERWYDMEVAAYEMSADAWRQRHF